MKKKLATAVLLIVCAAAHAQSSVEIYGVIDTGISYVSNSGGHPLYLEDSGIMRNNRLGFRGNEDLGSGMKAFFTLENGFSLDTGTASQGGLLFGRQSFVGLSNGMGSVMLGRQYDFMRESLSDFTIANYTTGYAFHPGDVDRLSGGRVNDSIKFMSAKVGGFTFGSLYGLGMPVNGTKTGRTLSFGVNYQNGKFTAGGAYSAIHDVSLDAASLFGVNSVMGISTVGPLNPATGLPTPKPLTANHETVYGFAMAYQQDKFRIQTLATNTNIKINNADTDFLNYEIGGVYFINPATFFGLGYTMSRFTGKEWGTLSSAIDYRFSKRTDIYLAALYVRAYDADSRAVTTTLAPSNGNYQSVVRVGIRHIF